MASQCFTDAFSKSSDPFIIDPWFSWVFSASCHTKDPHFLPFEAQFPPWISWIIGLCIDGWASAAMQHYALECKNLICLSSTSSIVLPESWLYNVFSWDVYCLYFILSFYISYVHDDESLDKGSCHQVTQTALVPCGRPPKAGRLWEGWPLWSYGGVEHVEHLRCFRSHLMGEVGVTFSACGSGGRSSMQDRWLQCSGNFAGSVYTYIVCAHRKLDQRIYWDLPEAIRLNWMANEPILREWSIWNGQQHRSRISHGISSIYDGVCFARECRGVLWGTPPQSWCTGQGLGKIASGRAERFNPFPLAPNSFPIDFNSP